MLLGIDAIPRFESQYFIWLGRLHPDREALMVEASPAFGLMGNLENQELCVF